MLSTSINQQAEDPDQIIETKPLEILDKNDLQEFIETIKTGKN